MHSRALESRRDRSMLQLLSLVLLWTRLQGQVSLEGEWRFRLSESQKREKSVSCLLSDCSVVLRGRTLEVRRGHLCLLDYNAIVVPAKCRIEVYDTDDILQASPSIIYFRFLSADEVVIYTSIVDMLVSPFLEPPLGVLRLRRLLSSCTN